MFLVMRIQKTIQTDSVFGCKVNTSVGDHIGFLSVYKTKKAAQKVWGKDVELVEVKLTENGRER